ncbi:MAG: lipid A deacylase LpxR family protein [Alphaproteobacteria bacterium]|nr:lipid A deacylase LpxR family protein [Alphaproteobacteria bacterium]
MFIFAVYMVCALPAWAQQRANVESAQNIAKQLNGRVDLERLLSERVKNADDHNYLSFSYENDLIGAGTDENYTSGLRVSYFDTETSVPPGIDTLADMIPTFDLNGTTSTFFTFGQNIYTPENINIRQLQRNDRPYAAWLYGSVGLATAENNHLDELEVTLGVVGPEALGEQTQKLIHRHVTDSDIPKGWSNQLDFEPGVILSWRRRWPVFYTANIGDFRFRLEPDINVSLGNVYTYAGTGGVITFGPYKSRLQDTPPRVRPAMPGTGFFDTPDQEFNWYLFAGLDGRAIGRNIFLDGNTFKGSHSVDKRHFVADANAGIAFGYDDYRLSYTLNYRTKEFDGQDDPSVFGSVTLTTRF